MLPKSRAVAVLLVMSIGMGAQEPAPTPAKSIVLAVTRYARREFGGPLAVEPRVYRAGWWKPDAQRHSDDALATILADMPDTRVRSLEEVHHCGARPDSCQLEGVQTVLAFDAPASTGDSAIVRVSVWFRSRSTRSPVGTAEYLLCLKKRAGGWVVTSAKPTRIT